MSGAELLIWGVVVHLLVDWLLQNEWQAVNKVSLKHPAAYVHAGMHGAAQLLVFPWWAALTIGVTHLLIDTRRPVEWWSRLIRQTQPGEPFSVEWVEGRAIQFYRRPGLLDIGSEVRIWADQVWHIAVVALLALIAA